MKGFSISEDQYSVKFPFSSVREVVIGFLDGQYGRIRPVGLSLPSCMEHMESALCFSSRFYSFCSLFNREVMICSDMTTPPLRVTSYDGVSYARALYLSLVAHPELKFQRKTRYKNTPVLL